MATTPPRVSIEDSKGSPASGNDGAAEVSSKEGNEVTSEISKEIGGVVEELNAADGNLSVGGKMASESEVSVSLSEYRIINDKEDLIPREMSLPPEVEKEKNSYAEVVSEGSTPSLVPEFTVVDGVADIEIPVEVFEDVAPLWKSCVVGYFMGDSPFIGSIHSTVNRIWSSQKSKIDVQFISKRTVLFRIGDELVRNRVLRRKCWHIADVPLVVSEWNPETAQAPPDLSALPLWVDLVNVPGYLYSLDGLRFLSRTTGKFVKLHPNTERCVRMDVARVLVEVNLMKPLPQKICFKNRDQERVIVQVHYPWLPSRCTSCDGWGHLVQDCTKVKQYTILQRNQTVEKEVNVTDSDMQLGKSAAAEPTKGKEVVLKLLDDLEKGVVNPGSARVATGASKKHVEVGSSGLSVSQKEGEWRLNGRPVSPRRINLTVPGRGVESPNGFQVLGNIREEGEIVDDVDCVQDPSTPQIEEVEVVERSEAAQASTMHLPGQKIRGKGGRGRLPVMPTKSFIHAVKASNSKKVFSKRK